MGFFKVTTDEESIKDYAGSNSKYINASGIYECILKSVIVDTSAKGSEFINLWIEHEGQEQPLFNAIRLTNTDGQANLEQALFNKLCIVCGASKDHDVNDPVSRMVPIAAKGAEKECMVLEDFDDTPVYIRIQMEYSLYDGKIQEKKNVKNFFRLEDKATASEIVNNTDFGKQYELEESKYADAITYKDGLTPEDVEEWKKNRSSTSKKEESTTTKPAGGFGGKRFGK